MQRSSQTARWVLSPAVDGAQRHQAAAMACLRVLAGLLWLYNVAWKRAPDFGQDADEINVDDLTDARGPVELAALAVPINPLAIHVLENEIGMSTRRHSRIEQWLVRQFELADEVFRALASVEVVAHGNGEPERKARVRLPQLPRHFVLLALAGAEVTQHGEALQ